MLVDIFSFWDYPVISGVFSGLCCMMFMFGCFFYFSILVCSWYWYSPTNGVSLLTKISMSFMVNVDKSNVRHVMGIGGLLMSLFFFTFVYVFGIFSPWCYPLGVHTVVITGISLSMWIMGVFCNILAEDLIYLGHFCLPGDGLGLSGVMSDIEMISKFLQWITVSLRLSLNMIVGTFMIIGVFNLVGSGEVLFCAIFWKKMSVMSIVKFFILGGIGIGAYIYEFMIMSLQVFLYLFLWQFYLKDNAKYCLYRSSPGSSYLIKKNKFKLKVSLTKNMLLTPTWYYYSSTFKEMVRLTMTNSCSILFWGVVMSGMILTISSMSWLGVWMGMEVSLLGIYGIFCGSFNQSEVLASLKYLLIQVLSASLILMGFLCRDWGLLVGVWGELLINLGIFMKVGIFPFYYWVMPVMSGLSWVSSWVFCTLQKIIPLVAFCVVLEFYVILSDICALMSVMLSGVEGARQVSIRGIFAYSSIGQSGWLLLLCSRGDSLSIVWFSIIYSLVLVTVFWSFLKYDIYSSSFMGKGLAGMNLLIMYNVVVIFSLAGLPPLLGFIPKVLVLGEVGFSLGIFSLGLLWAVLASIWFYTSFLFSFTIESFGNFYCLKMMTFFGKLKNFLIFVFFFTFNVWGGLLYFLL